MIDLNDLARSIIEKNQYLALSTVNENRRPWTCILAYTFDVNFNFYFVSLPTANHSRHIENLKDVSFAIYDSTQGFGLGTGLQIEGIAEVLNQERIPEITNIYFSRKYPYGNISNDFTTGLKNLLNDKVYSFYKLTPSHIWMNDPNSDTDKRVEIFLR